jgi:transcriptional regulator GlxA family with amidase domain
MFEPSGVDVFGSLSHLDGRTEDSRIKRAIKLIQEKSNQPLSMAELAKNSGVSTRNLNRLFLAELEMTPKQVITLFRIESAKKLLKAGRMSVTDVTFEVGYNSVSQFISTFRKLTGQLPSEYR